jgi:hypothetical protein
MQPALAVLITLAASKGHKKIASGFDSGLPAKTGKAPQERRKGVEKGVFSSVPTGLDSI